MDMLNRTYGHMEGLSEENIPLFIADTANWQFAKKYKGEKYIIPCNNLYLTKIFYETKGIKPWKAMGTVVSFAIQLALFFSAGSIELIGVDLAFPNNVSHASQTMDYKEIDCDNSLKVDSVDGGKVSTSGELITYIKEIEGLIAENKNVSFFNRSRYGALIKGCKEPDLSKL